VSEYPLNELVESKPQDVLSLLAIFADRSTGGVLRYEPHPDPDHVVEFLVRGGKLLFATTNQPGARTAEILVRHGVLNEEAASVALRDARRLGRLFHGFVVERGLVRRELLEELLFLRAEELLHSVLHAEQGRLVLEQSELRRFDGQIPTVDEHLYTRLLMYRQPWQSAYAKLRGRRLVLRRTPGIEAMPGYRSLGAAEHWALEVVDDRRPLQQLLGGRTDRVELTVLLAQFLEMGLLEVAAPEPVLEPWPPLALERVDASSAVAPIDLDAIVSLAPGIDLAEIPAEGLTMDELFVLSQIDGRTSLRQLISITGMAEKPLFALLHRGLAHEYLSLQDRPVSGPPVRSLRRPSRVTAVPAQPRPAAPAPVQSEAEAPAGPPGPQAEAQQLHARALAAYNAQSFPAAEELLRQAVALDAGLPCLRAHLALVLAEQPGQSAEAEQMAEAAVEDDPLSAHCLEALGLIKLKLGAYGPARRLLERALSLERRLVPSSARILDELGANDPRKSGTAEKIWATLRKRIQLKL
jgi:hypothetical protein